MPKPTYLKMSVFINNSLQCCSNSTLDEIAIMYQIENNSICMRSFIDDMEVDDYIAWKNAPFM